MKKVKQWEKPEIGTVARSSSMEAVVAPARGGYIGPLPPTPGSTDVIRRDSTRSFVGFGPLPPILD